MVEKTFFAKRFYFLHPLSLDLETFTHGIMNGNMALLKMNEARNKPVFLLKKTDGNSESTKQ